MEICIIKEVDNYPEFGKSQTLLLRNILLDLDFPIDDIKKGRKGMVLLVLQFE